MKNRIVKLSLFFFWIANPCVAGYFQRLVISSDGTPYLNVYTRQGSLNIMKYNSQHKALDVYFPIPDQEKCHINYSALDPTGNKLAYFGYCKLTNIISSETSVQGFYHLAVVDIKNKRVIIDFDHGGNLFSFSPKGDAIVYAEDIPGEPGSPAPPGYQGSVWLYNFNTKAKKKIDVNLRLIRDINWSEHDGNIYITNNQYVYLYDVKKGKGDIVPYKGIYFSPDGKYYCDYEMASSNIYRTSDNQKMIDWKKTINERSNWNDSSMIFQFWSKKLNAGIFSVRGGINVIFDINEGKVIGEFNGDIIGTNPIGTLVAVHPPGKDNQGKVEILNLLDLIKK